MKTEEKALLKLMGAGKGGLTMDNQMVAINKAAVSLQSLGPTSDATELHSVRVFKFGA